MSKEALFYIILSIINALVFTNLSIDNKESKWIRLMPAFFEFAALIMLAIIYFR